MTIGDRLWGVFCYGGLLALAILTAQSGREYGIAVMGGLLGLFGLIAVLWPNEGPR